MLSIFMLFLTSISFAQEPIRVAVVDTGINLTDIRITTHICADGLMDFTGTGIQDTHGHGTHVTGLIIQEAKDSNYCLLILKYHTGVENSKSWSQTAFIYASKLGASIVNFSSGGPNDDPKERKIIELLSDITFIVAAGNDNKSLNDIPYYPAAYLFPNVIAVGNLQEDGSKCESSNWGTMVKSWEMGTHVSSFDLQGDYVRQTGTSMAAAIKTGKYVYEMSHRHR